MLECFKRLKKSQKRQNKKDNKLRRYSDVRFKKSKANTECLNNGTTENTQPKCDSVCSNSIYAFRYTND